MSSEEKVKLEIEVDKRVYERISKLAESLKSTPVELAKSYIEILAEYSDDVASLGKELMVGDDKRAVSTLEELVYYGVESWRSIVNTILDMLGAKGCFELESMDFEPLEPLIELDLVALEGCNLKADKITISWSPRGVSVELTYYLESKPRPQPKLKIPYEWSYLPDEHAIIISLTGSSILEIPRLDKVDEEASKLGL